MSKTVRKRFRVVLLALAGLMAGCGSDYPVFHPAGPVARMELHLIVLSTIVFSVLILLIWVLFTIVLVRFRDVPGNKAPYRPNWVHHRTLEVLVFALPVAALLVVAVPTVQKTYALAHVPSRRPLVVDVTALDFKWVFEYPRQRIATVNYADIPAGRPVLFELTSRSPMAAFWVPNLGGMEYAMPNRVLPLWLEAKRGGSFLGRNANFNGIDYWRMTFLVNSLPPAAFRRWTATVKHADPPMTESDWRRLSRAGTINPQSYSSYPADTFPMKVSQFTVKGLYYAPQHKP